MTISGPKTMRFMSTNVKETRSEGQALDVGNLSNL